MAAVNSATLSGDPRVDALIDGTKWAGAITFSFPTSASDYGDYTHSPKEYELGFSPLSAAYQTATRWIMTGSSFGSFAAFMNLGISEASGGAGVIRLANSSEPDTAYAYMPWSNAAGGDVWFGDPYMTSRPDPQPGNYAWATTMHEIGHALGLKHGQETDGLSGQAVPSAWDSLEFTIMTYRSYVGDPLTGGYSNETWGFPQTPMMLDIAALQQMYGADFTANAGDSVYTFNPSTGAMSINGSVAHTPGANRVFLTVWDGGGTDTYDFSAYSGGVAIDLTPGGWSLLSNTQLANLGDGHMARANVFNALQYQGDARSLIENAIGGAGQDYIVGNSAANRITGRGGGDNLTGGGGADTFVFLAASDFTTTDDITDFTGGADRLDFSAIGGLTFIGSGAFTSVAGQMNYTHSGGMTLVRYDGNGDGTADAIVRLLGGSFTLSETAGGSKILQAAAVADTTAPTLSSTSPADNGSNVAVGANLTMTFSEAVQAGTGSIVIRRTSDASIVATIAVTDTSQVSFSGATMTVNPTADLAAGTGYYVTVASTAVRDAAGNAYAGISSATAFNFTTAAAPVDDYDDSSATTGQVTVGGNATGNVETAGDVDWFRVTLSAGQTYRFDLEGVDTGQGTLVDPLLQLMNSGGALLAEYDDGGVHWNSRGTYTATSSGTFYLAAQSFDADGGTYRISVANVTADTTAPTLSSTTPADNATGVAVGANLVLTFSEAVQAGTGSIEIRRTSDASLVRSIAVTDASQVSFSGSTVTLNPATDLAASTGYYVVMGSGVIRDAAGNTYAGISGATAFNFTTAAAPDTAAPTLSATTPADNATGVAVGANLTLTFSEAVQAGTGAIEIRKVSDGSLVRSISVTDGSQVSIAGSTLTVNPAADLAAGTAYYVTMASGVIRDLAGNAYAGLSGATAFNFATAAPVDSTAPTLASTSPTDNATGVAVGANLTLTFSEAVQAGTGAIEIRKVSDGSLVRSISVTDGAQVSISGSTVTLNPATDLATSTAYYLVMASGVIRDLAGNAFAGLSGATAFNFTTVAPVDTTAPQLVSTTPSDNAASVAVDADFVLTFNEAVQAGAGAIEICRASDGSLFRSISAGDTGQVSISGSTVTVDSAADLATGTAYYITVASGAFADTAGNAFAGLSGATAFNFTTASATPGTDVLAGGGGADVMDGLGGDDTLQGLGGDDQLTGGAGTDKALYATSSANYAWWSNGDGTWTVKDLRSGSPEGTDTLITVEQLAFSDRTIKIAGASNAEALTYAFENILRKTVSGADLGFVSSLANQVSIGTKSMSAAIGEIVQRADQTTAVASMSYQFFMGYAPGKGGFDYLISPQGPNPNNINSAYYQGFSLENRYINFAVNLGKLGEGRPGFENDYGSLTLFEATEKAYLEIFGGAPTDAKVDLILNSSVGAMTRAEYFAAYGGDGLQGIGTKAAMVGWLLTEAVKADLGTMALSSNAYFTDLADGAQFQVDLVGVYGQSGWAFSG